MGEFSSAPTPFLDILNLAGIMTPSLKLGAA